MDQQQVFEKFQQHNRTRIARFYEMMPHKKRAFFQLLPLIFETNDPNLPCYVEDAPYGLPDYEPSRRLLSIAKTLNRKFQYESQSFHQFPIPGIYLINDYGFINYPLDPSFELLIVHSNYIRLEHIRLLTKKLEQVVHWAKAFDLKITTRLVNEKAIQKSLPSDYLDRFYINGLILAGAVPMWWFIPPDQEGDYEEIAKAIKTMPEDALTKIIKVDFGPLTAPSERSAKAAYRESYISTMRAMRYGLPTFLELFYQRTVLEHFPESPWLSPQYKHAVYNNGDTDTFFADANILKLNFLSDKLSKTLLGLARQSLYLRCDEKLTFSVQKSPHQWRRDGLIALPDSWSWSDYNISQLDHRFEARFRQRISEYKQTQLITDKFSELLGQFAEQHELDVAKQQRALAVLHRKLFEIESDNIPTLPATYLPATSEEHLFVERSGAQSDWKLYDSESGAASGTNPIYSHASLLQTLTWAIINQALSKTTRVRTTDHSHEVTSTMAQALLEHLLKSPIADAKVSENGNADLLVSFLVFANIEETPKEAFKRQDLKLSKRQLDPLSYGFHARNLMTSLEAIAINGRGQCFALKFQGPNAIAEVLTAFLRWKPSADTCQVDSWCQTPNLGPKITQRLKSTFSEVQQHYSQHPESGNYLFDISDHIFNIQWHEQGSDFEIAPKNLSIDHIMAKTRSIFSASRIDKMADYEGRLSIMLEQQASNKINVFLHNNKQQTNFYILDEMGSLYQYSSPSLKEQLLVSYLNEFISSTLSKKNISLNFFELTSRDGAWSTAEHFITPISDINSSFPVKIELSDASEQATCNIRCGTKMYSGAITNKDLFKKVRELVSELENTNKDYPLYISQLSYTSQVNYPSRHFINKKQQLEALLNNSE